MSDQTNVVSAGARNLSADIIPGLTPKQVAGAIALLGQAVVEKLGTEKAIGAAVDTELVSLAAGLSAEAIAKAVTGHTPADRVDLDGVFLEDAGIVGDLLREAKAAPDITIQLSIAPDVFAPSKARTMTMTEIAAAIMALPAVGDKLDGYALHFAKFPDGALKRERSNCGGGSAIVLDFDGRDGNTVTRGDLESKVRAKGLAAIFYDSFSADASGTTFRCFLPSLKLIPIEYYKSASAYVCSQVLEIKAPNLLFPASQPYFCQPRMGRDPRVTHYFGAAIDTTFNVSDLEFEQVVREASKGDDFAHMPEPKLQAPGAMAELLQKMDPDLGRLDWRTVISSIHMHLGEGGREVAREWCRRGEKYLLNLKPPHRPVSEEVADRQFNEVWKEIAKNTGFRMGAGALLDILKRQYEHGGGMFGMSTEDLARWNDAARASGADEAPSHRPPPPAELVPPHLPDPFPGAHKALVEAATKSLYLVQPDLANLAVLVAMASALHGGYRYADGLRCNLYGGLLADTAEGKELPVNIAQMLASRLGAKTCSKPASGEALEDQLVSGQGLLVLFREAGHIFSVMAGKNAAAHHVSLAANLLDYYSASSRTHEKRVRAALRGQREVEVEEIPYPMTNVLLASTPDKLGEALTSDNIKDGLLGRILFAFGRKDALRNPDCEDFTAAALAFTKPDVGGQAAVIRWSREAESVRHPIEDGNLARKRELQAQGESIEAALIGRLFERAKRIAGVLAVWESASDPVVTRPMLEWALAFVKASDDGLRVFIRKFMHDSAVHADAEKIIAGMRRVHSGSVKPMTPSQFALIAAGHLPRTMVMKSSGLEPKRFDEALKLLEGTEQVRQYRVAYKKGLRDENALAITFC